MANEDKKKKKLQSIAKKGAKGFAKGNMEGGDSGVYREFGDRDEVNVDRSKSLTYRGTTYNQRTTPVEIWGRVLHQTGVAPGGSYFRYRGKIYKSGTLGGRGSELQTH